MKLLYLSTWDFANEKSDGVCKKIYSHISVFEEEGYSVDFIFIRGNDIIYREDGQEKIIGKVGNIKKTPAYLKMYKCIKYKRYDWVYNRYGMMDTFYYRVLKRLHKNGARILIEIPTFPYINELPQNCLYRLMEKWDAFYIRKLDKLVDRIATYSLDEEIFGIKTIRIVNGVDFSSIKIKEPKTTNTCLDLIGVANLSKWHGFDRVIMGMIEYYSLENVTKKVKFHIVGDGTELETYKQLVKENKLTEAVIFYGRKQGEELDAIYNEADLAVSSLGLHRIGINTQASVLKSREYAAKGLPMLSSIMIDVFPTDKYKYIKYFQEDDTPINISEVVEWFENLQEESDIRYFIREYAFNKCDKSVVMKPIIKYMGGQ